MGKLPAFQFYPGDWYRDGVSGCSLAAQGLWLRMMFVMFDAERRGYLAVNGRPMWDEFIASKCGIDVTSYRTLLEELSRAGIPRKTSDGIIYNKRMVDDERERVQTKERVKKHRSNGDVTPVKRRRTEDEVEDEVLAKELPKISLAQKVAGEMCLQGPGVIQEIAGAIAFLEKHDGKSPNAAVEFLIAQGKDEIDRGGAPDRFWFASRKWRATTVQPRMTREDLARKQAFEEAERKDRAKGAGV